MANRQALGAALGGMLTAVSLVLLLLTGVFPMAELVLPAIAGVLLIAAVLELNIRWAWGIFAAVCILGLLLSPNKDAAIYYLFFFGHYPLLKNYIERLHSRVLQWIIKLPLFNACAVLAYLLILKLFGVPESAGRYGWPILLALMNIAFVLYDIALTQLIATYVLRLRRRFHRR